MINVEKLIYDLHRQGINRKDVDKKYEASGLKDKFTTNIPSLDDMNKDLVAMMKMGYMAHVENQNGKINTVEAKYNTIMDIHGLMTDGTLLLAPESKLTLYHNVVHLMANRKIEKDSTNFKSLNAVRMNMERDLFKSADADYDFEVSSKKIINKAEKLAEAAYTM